MSHLQALWSAAEELEHRGDWDGAVQRYCQVFVDAVRAGDLVLVVDACRREGWLRVRLGQLEEGEELLELSRVIAERSSMARAAARAGNALAAMWYQAGELDRARTLYETALDRARAGGDDELIGSICQNLGVIANIRGALSEAHGLYLECVGAAVRSGNRRLAMMAYNNLGMVYSDRREWLEAEISLGRGIEIAEQVGDVAVQANLLINRVEPLLQFGDYPAARETLRAAEEIAALAQDSTHRCDIERFWATLNRLERDHDAAERHLERALALADDPGRGLERGEALEEMARLRRAQERPGPARMLLREARRCYESVGAVNDIRRVEEMLAELSPSPTSPTAVESR